MLNEAQLRAGILEHWPTADKGTVEGLIAMYKADPEGSVNSIMGLLWARQYIRPMTDEERNRAKEREEANRG